MRRLLAAALCAALAACQGGGARPPSAAPARTAGTSQGSSELIHIAHLSRLIPDDHATCKPGPPPAGPQSVAAAESHPLGSRANPVRVCMPPGERAYLARLRCRTGQAPEVTRMGPAGVGPHGYVLDRYAVRCGADRRDVYMDMYHPRREDRPVPGFSITPAG